MNVSKVPSTVRLNIELTYDEYGMFIRMLNHVAGGNTSLPATVDTFAVHLIDALES